MNQNRIGVAITLLMFVPLAVAAVAPAGWIMLLSLALTLVLQLAAIVCFYPQSIAKDDSKPH
jgi:hypothetical protein